MNATTYNSPIPLILQSSFQRKMVQNVYQGAKKGALTGALVGSAFITSAVTQVTITGLLERGNRALGNEPKWPIFREDGDCELEQFKDLGLCTNATPIDSLTSFTVCVIGASTICGMVTGAVSGAAKTVFKG